MGNICAVTTRFFGGTKLGTGGLVKAYTESIQLCLASLVTEKNIQLDHFTMLVPYNHFNLVMSILSSSKVDNIDTQFNDKITISFNIERQAVLSLNETLRNATAGTVRLMD